MADQGYLLVDLLGLRPVFVCVCVCCTVAIYSIYAVYETLLRLLVNHKSENEIPNILLRYPPFHSICGQ